MTRPSETKEENGITYRRCSAKIHQGDRWLPTLDFHNSKNVDDGIANQCCHCVSERGRIDRERIKMDSYRRKVFLESRRRERERGGKQRQLFYAAMERARKKNLDFNITIEDIKIPTICPILKIPIVPGKGRKGKKSMSGPGNRDSSPSVDRIDNDKGYVKGNVRVISWRANYLKNTATLEELILLGEDAEQQKGIMEAFDE